MKISNSETYETYVIIKAKYSSFNCTLSDDILVSILTAYEAKVFLFIK